MKARAITGRIAAWAVNVPIAFIALRTNLMRSILTTLGIMIGVLSVILAVAVGEGTKVSVLDSINAIGSNQALKPWCPHPRQPRGSLKVRQS